MFHMAKYKPQPLTSTSNTRYLQTEWCLHFCAATAVNKDSQTL